MEDVLDIRIVRKVINMIPLFKPYMPKLPEMDKVLYSEALAYGEYTKEFERKLKEYFDTEYLIVTNSFTSSISVALTTFGIEQGDEVILSPMACLVSTLPYLSSGIYIKWADIDPLKGTLLPESVEEQITSKTKAIIHNHYCGYPGHIDEINNIGKKYGIPVIDDGIECFGSEYKNQKIGCCSTNLAIFSLSAVRIPNCIDGGIIIFKDKNLYNKSLMIRDCGIDRIKFRDILGEINPKYDINTIGYSATMSNVNGYIGVQQMEYVNKLLDAQRRQAAKWNDFFEEQSQYIPIHCKNTNPNYWVYGILSDNKLDTIKKFRDMGYYASGVHIRNDLYSIFGKQDVDLRGVREFYNRFVALPCGWWME